MRRITLSLGDGETSGIAFGAAGPPDLVFLHATGFNAHTYRSLLQPLGERFRVVAIDQRGHGRSRLPADATRLHNWRIYADDYLDLAARAWPAAPPPVMAGHSLGGAVSLMAAARRPGLAAALVLFDPVIPPMKYVLANRSTTSQATRVGRIPIAQGAAWRRGRFASKDEAVASYRGRAAFATWREPFLADYVEDGFVDAPEGGVTLACAPAWEAATFASVGKHPAAGLKLLHIPVAVLKAERGTVVHLPDDKLTRLKPDIVIETVPGTTHFLPMEQPDLLRDRLHAALEARASQMAAGC